ncbi:MAG: hypothetical protein JNN03_10575 [Rubrivivax sp.]|nr:hypothetical protein [Rubrivivax sp.]
MRTPKSTTSNPSPGRGGEAERWFALALRTVHLAGVVALGAALMGAPLARSASGIVVLASGTLLLVQDLRAGRMAVRELAGAVVLAKLLAVAWVTWADRHALAVFWCLLVVSSLSSHAPKRWRHWSPGRR